MTWQTMPTFTNGPLTAGQLNILRDNLLETAPAKATTAGYHFVANGTNTIVQRAIVSDKVLTQQTTTNASYVNLTTVGPDVTVTTGAKALVMIGCQMFHSGTGSCWSSYEVTGASSVSAADDHAITCEAAATNSFRFSYCELQPLSAGVNTFTQKYRVGSPTGTFDDRHIIVMAL